MHFTSLSRKLCDHLVWLPLFGSPLLGLPLIGLPLVGLPLIGAVGCTGGATKPTASAVSGGESATEVDSSRLGAPSASQEMEPAVGGSEAEPTRISPDDLRLAAFDGDETTVRKALASGTNVNATDPERSLTPLHMAAYNGHADVVRLLLENGAQLDARDIEGKTPLLHACTGPFAETVELLLSAGADVNASETTEAFTPLMMGAGLGEIDVVKVLLRHNADKRLRDNDGDTAMMHAQNAGHTQIVELLAD